MERRYTGRLENEIRAILLALALSAPSLPIFSQKAEAAQKVEPTDITEENIPPKEPTVEGKLQNYQVEFETVVRPKFIENQALLASLRQDGIFANPDLLEGYYLIFRTSQDAFNVPWNLLWLVIVEESTMSQDSNAFAPKVLHYGAMQRAVNTYSKYEVREISQNFSYLSGLSQNHSDDWEEILWAAAKLSRDARQAQETARQKGLEKNWEWALVDALHAYSAGEVARNRAEKFKVLQTIFGRAG